MQNLLKVEVEGLSRLEVQDIYRISGLYPSLYFESDNDFNVKINQGIQKLWEIERFADIQIYEIDNISSSNTSKSIVISLKPPCVMFSVTFFFASLLYSYPGGDFISFLEVFLLQIFVRRFITQCKIRANVQAV